MAVFKKGDQVRLKSVVPEGPITALRMDEDGNVSYCVEWADAKGEIQQRWFDEDQLASA
jgi:uncharacterized protein YodC (DUF2158 family)